jgi:hypothetical protein
MQHRPARGRYGQRIIQNAKGINLNVKPVLRHLIAYIAGETGTDKQDAVLISNLERRFRYFYICTVTYHLTLFFDYNGTKVNKNG